MIDKPIYPLDSTVRFITDNVTTKTHATINLVTDRLDSRPYSGLL